MTMSYESVQNLKTHTMTDFKESGNHKAPSTDPLTNGNIRGRLAKTIKIYSNDLPKTLVQCPLEINTEKQVETKLNIRTPTREYPKKRRNSQGERTNTITISTDSRLIIQLIGTEKEEDEKFSEKIQDLLKFVDHHGFWMIASRNENPQNDKENTNSNKTNEHKTDEASLKLVTPQPEQKKTSFDRSNQATALVDDKTKQISMENLGNVLSLDLKSNSNEDINLQEKPNSSGIRRLLLVPINSQINVKQKQDQCLLCAVLVSGDAESLKMIKILLGQKMPIIYLKGSGEVADNFFHLSKTKKSKRFKDFLLSECAEIYQEYRDLMIPLDLKDGDYLNKISKIVLKSLNYVTQDTEVNALAFGSLCIKFNQLEDLIHHKCLKEIFRKQDSAMVKKLTKEIIKCDRCKILEYLLDNGKTTLKYIKPNDITPIPGRDGTSPHKDIKDNDSEKKPISSENDNTNETETDLFKAAIESKRIELSKLLWLKVKHPTGAALYAFGKLDKMERKEERNIKKGCKEIKEMKKVFLEYAIATINLNYRVSAHKTRDILLLEMKPWEETSCVKLAIDSHNGKFLTQPPCSDLLNSLLQSENTNDQNKNTLNFLSARVLMVLNLIGVIAFLIAYAVLLVSFLKADIFHILEWIIMACVITFLFELINQMARNPFSKIRSKFTVIAIISQILFLVAWILRIIAYYEPGNPEYMIWARIIFSLDYITFSLTVFEFFSMSRFLGPLILTLWQMTRIFIKFCAIILVLFIAYAVASESVLNPITEPNPKVAFFLFRKAFWGMFADFFLEELETDASNTNPNCSNNPDDYKSYETLRCPTYSGRYFVSILLGVYFIAVNLFLFNVLIAKFSSKIKEIEERAIEIWALQSMTYTLKYLYQVFLPIPFTVLTPLLIWIQCHRSKDILVTEDRSEHELITLSNMQNDVRQTYIDSLEEKPEMLLVQCSVHCPHAEGQNVIHERVVTLPTKSERLTEETAVVVLTSPRKGVLDNDAISNRSNGKKDTRKRFFAVRSQYKYGIRWQCVAVKPRMERTASVQENDFDVNVGYSVNTPRV